MSEETEKEKATTQHKQQFEPSHKDEWTLISQGAEARVWKLRASTTAGDDGDTSSSSTVVDVICKERFSKSYRHPDLDARLTKSRCRSEAKLLEKCAKKSVIRVPGVLRVSPPSLYLEHLEGPSVKSYLLEKEDTSDTLSETDLASKMGELLGRLHKIGIVHGDLTTSNMMLLLKNDDDNASTSSYELALIDFGLSKSTVSVEEQAVDLYVLERALLSTHPDLADNFFDLVLEAYETETTTPNEKAEGKKRKNNSQTTLQRLEQVRMRGRKRECFG